MWEFYWTQLRFIPGQVWWVQLLILACVALLVQSYGLETQPRVQLVMLVSVTAPLLVMTGIQTVTRSLSFKMFEIELSTLHLLEKLTLTRMSLLGMADLAGLAILSIFVSRYLHTGAWILLLYMLVAFNMACFGCLWLLHRVRTSQCGYYCLLFVSMLALLQIILSFQPDLPLFDSTAVVWWLAAFFLTGIGIAVEVRGIYIKGGNMECWS